MTSSTGDPTLQVGGPQVAWRETGAEIVVLDLKESLYFGLNPTAARLWKLLVRGSTRTQLAQHLQHEQGISAERAQADVDTFLELLDREGLLATV